MAEPIHVAAEDELPVIIERIRRPSSDEVQLMLPPRCRVGQSRFNFQLLRQYATRLGKRGALSTLDAAVQRMAEENGCQVVHAVRTAPAPQPAPRMAAPPAGAPQPRPGPRLPGVPVAAGMGVGGAAGAAGAAQMGGAASGGGVQS